MPDGPTRLGVAPSSRRRALRFACPLSGFPFSSFHMRPGNESRSETRRREVVGVTGLEPATSRSRTVRSTSLSYTPAITSMEGQAAADQGFGS